MLVAGEVIGDPLEKAALEVRTDVTEHRLQWHYISIWLHASWCRLMIGSQTFGKSSTGDENNELAPRTQAKVALLKVGVDMQFLPLELQQ
jgi:hypothetical protein